MPSEDEIAKQSLHHELHDFIAASAREIGDEYNRIEGRAREDPGTAGDEGEENWAALLRDWLPPSFQIVTKGRILGHTGEASRQMDVIVLHPDYPSGLTNTNKKLYLAGGVLAAFECKLTLKPKHIEETIKKSVHLRKLLPIETGTPYKELTSSIIYGLLAHSHSWIGKNSVPIENLDQQLRDADLEHVKHPREMLDIICLANLGTWLGEKYPSPEGDDFPMTMYTHYPRSSSPLASSEYVEEVASPVGDMIFWLLYKLAWEYPSLRKFIHYYHASRLHSEMRRGTTRFWNWNIFTDPVIEGIRSGNKMNDEAWNEWSFKIY